MYTTTIQTADGPFEAAFSEKGLASLRFPRSPQESDEGTRDWKSTNRWVEQTRRALQAVLRGESCSDLPPLDMSAGTPFQQAVWKVLRGIPRGSTLSYQEVASRVGRPTAARAVGGACGANPIPVLVPCHRVLAANRKIGGFSGGLDWKRKLLKREEVPHRA